MEKLANQISETISKNMNYDQDKQEVIAYGLIALFQMTTIALSVLIIGLLAGFWIEAIIIFLGAGLLRKSTGGAHAQTLLGCTVLSIILISVLSALSRYILIDITSLYISIPVNAVLILICLYIAYRRAPVDSPNKPIKRPEKIKRLRKQSFITIGAYGALCITFAFLSNYIPRFMSLSGAVLCALLWQTFTLTKWGESVINFLEIPFNRN